MEKEYRGTWERAAERFLSFFYPRRCPVCQEIVSPKGALICPDCRKQVTFIEEPVCRKCGREVNSLEQEYCSSCRMHPRSFSEGLSLMRYDEVGQKTMMAFKYQGRIEYADWYAKEMAERLGERMERWQADALVPVPLYKSRQRKRGYNQAEVLAKKLAVYLGLPVRMDLLRRVRKKEAQKNLGWEARQRNLQAAMEARPLPEEVRRIILVDDIYTSGATAEACTRVLRRAGAEEVFVVTVCSVEE